MQEHLDPEDIYETASSFARFLQRLHAAPARLVDCALHQITSQPVQPAAVSAVYSKVCAGRDLAVQIVAAARARHLNQITFFPPRAAW